MRVPKSLIISLIVIVGIAAFLMKGVFSLRNMLRTKNEKPVIQPLPEEKITLLEGWTVKDIALYLDKKNITQAEKFLATESTFDRTSYVELATIPKEKDLEGFLFPDTYRILKNSTNEEIIQKILANFKTKFGQASRGVVVTDGRYVIPGYETYGTKNGSGLSAYQIVTLASIIEKEASSNGTSEVMQQEKQTIAGIFYNRLVKGMPLESDATINYVTNGNRPSPTEADLATNSPYNTYKNPGLPPGPINNPSYQSLYAALHPLKTEYYYFLHKQPSGEVVYSKTFDEHVQNKFKYLR